MLLKNDDINFPPVNSAAADGLLAVGGDLKTERLLTAYRQGIFPWYNEGDIIQWWCPNPRFVLYPDALKVSNSMQTILNNGTYRFTVNRAFDAVIKNCKNITRPGQDGTWIQDEVVKAYTQ